MAKKGQHEAYNKQDELGCSRRVRSFLLTVAHVVLLVLQHRELVMNEKRTGLWLRQTLEWLQRSHSLAILGVPLINMIGMLA
jgi:hypothetical protein